MIMYDANNIADYVLVYGDKHNYFLSNLKLQKLLYMIQAYFLIVKDKPCFFNPIEAWDFGSVVPEVYSCYKFFGSTTIPAPKYKNFDITKKDKKLINEVVDEFKEYTSVDLMKLIHNQTPYQEAFKNKTVISIDSLRRFFCDEEGVEDDERAN